jgi:hypothetical protein
VCRNHLRRRRVPLSEITPEELISEVWQKLLGTVSLPNQEAPGNYPGSAAEWSIDPHRPEFDGRVVWLVQEIGGSESLAHRCLRQRYGRSLPDGGRRMVQLGTEKQTLDRCGVGFSQRLIWFFHKTTMSRCYFG